MAVDVRLIEPHEVPDFIRSVLVPFLEVGKEGAVKHWSPHIEVDRCWIAQDGGRAVGNCCVFSRDVTVPAAPGRECPTIPMAAVSAVGVHPTHRRQGLLRRMMGVMFDDARRRGEMVTGLTASESVIYGRFGYGLATTAAELAIDTRGAAFVAAAPRLDLRILDPDEAAKELPERFDRLRRRRAGEVSRNQATWGDVFA
ncbi:MAG: GNAT family N-acetyltransferase, partial [Acidimicrobiales bacterium]